MSASIGVEMELVEANKLSGKIVPGLLKEYEELSDEPAALNPRPQFWKPKSVNTISGSRSDRILSRRSIRKKAPRFLSRTVTLSVRYEIS